MPQASLRRRSDTPGCCSLSAHGTAAGHQNFLACDSEQIKLMCFRCHSGMVRGDSSKSPHEGFPEELFAAKLKRSMAAFVARRLRGLLGPVPNARKG